MNMSMTIYVFAFIKYILHLRFVKTKIKNLRNISMKL